MNPNRQKLEAVFDATLELVGAEREIYLVRACAGNPELQRQVERLLRASDRAGNFLEREQPSAPPAYGPSQESTAAADPAMAAEVPTVNLASAADGPGAVIGRYKLLEKLGEGGFGEVWMAEQREPVRRRVALKIVKLGMDTRQVVGRFESERQALALMDHPNIAKVLDAGATATGRPYFVMELVRGIRITEYCDQNHLPTQEQLDLFIKVCHAIQHARLQVASSMALGP